MKRPTDEQIVISASRRTDIPAFYMDDFMAQVRRGWFEAVNPYNRKVSRVECDPSAVHTIVFWSKNFSHFISGGYGESLIDMGYRLYFQFTVNSDVRQLEPKVPPLGNRLHQMETLCQKFGAKTINWRFDPICFYREKTGGGIKNNLKDFPAIARRAGESGIRRCTASFMDHYPKIQRRARSIPGFGFIDPPMAEKTRLILKMARRLKDRNMDLYLCCEKDVLAHLPDPDAARQAACIPSDRLMKMFGGRLSLKKDSGQRVKQGCGCGKSIDVGVYHLQPCRHNCLFCYANPASGHVAEPGEKTDPHAYRPAGTR